MRMICFLVVVACALLPLGLHAGLPDCNNNSIDDAVDISTGTSLDCDLDGVPDECQTAVAFTEQPVGEYVPAFTADLDGDGDVDILGSHRWFENVDGNGSFGPARLIGALGGGASDAADLDGDGDLDVLSSFPHDLPGPDTVVWYENLDGDGNFGPPLLVAEQYNDYFGPSKGADIDGDGDVDVVNSGGLINRISWYENLDGFGNFGPRQVVALDPDEPRPFGPLVVDMDGDQDLDIFISSYRGAKISWYENTDGLGTFGPIRIIRVGNDNAGQAFPADVDGDMDLDALVLIDTTNEIFWVENLDGAGNFGPDQPMDILAGGSPLNIRGDDFDGDGDIDALVTTQGDLIWYENTDGAGSFASPRTIAIAHSAFIDTADIDGDTDIDVIHSQSDTSTVVWHRNDSQDCNGNGTVDSCDLSGLTSNDCNANAIPDECDTSSGGDCNANDVPDSCDIAASTSTDCTANGIPDECEEDCNNNSIADSCDILATTSTDCDTNGIPDECEPDCNSNSVADACDILAATSGDCTGNHVPDECEADCNGNSTADVCELDLGTANDCDGNGQLDQCDITGGRPDCNANGVPDDCEVEVKFVERVLSTGNGSVFAADLDGDGDPDAVRWATDAGEIGWYENLDGAGSFGARQVVDIGAAPGRIFAADLDGDEDREILTASGSWYANVDGLGTFGPAQTATTAGGIRSASDIDGDGDQDLLSLFTDVELQIAWHANDGAGNFGAAQFITNRAWEFIVCDLDGDGHGDLVQSGENEESETETLWRVNIGGSGTFGPEQFIAGPGQFAFSLASCVDLDGDGDNDLVGTFNWSENVNGLGTSFTLHSLDSLFVGLAVPSSPGDFDGDGDLDIMVAGDDITVWYEHLDGQGAFSSPKIVDFFFGGFGWSPAPADVDGDGDLDFLWSQQAWYENLSNDCNGNATPDLCESDCNLNGAEDSCEIAARPFSDCDHTLVLDECETGCADPLLCNSDGDLCIDGTDCAPSDPSVWAEPEPLRSLRISKPSPVVALLSWGNSPSPGADSVTYSQLRSTDPSDFAGAAICFGIGDGSIPPAGTAFFYVVRVKNGCPASIGTIGTDSNGVPRAGLTCP